MIKKRLLSIKPNNETSRKIDTLLICISDVKEGHFNTILAFSVA